MSDDAHPEIVIIRRGGHGDHDEHHGGVWKIAFADFMTAMMAFFLVMWLISANDKTRASVARYFNPVRLVDATTQPRGLHDTKKDESGITASPNTKSDKDKAGKEGKPEKEEAKDEGKSDGKADGKAEAKPEQPGKETAAARETRLDAALRDNPFAVLAEIAGKAVPQATGRRAGDAFRDPFAPPPPSRPDDEIRLEAPTDDRLASPGSAGAAVPDAQAKDVKAAAAKPADAAASRPAEMRAVDADPVDAAPAAVATSPAAGAHDGVAGAVAAALRDATSGRDGPRVAVERTPEGVLVSLTDTAGFTMFANGSAVPARKLVLLMEGIAAVLKARPGTVVVRGFTDSKPFKGTRYDNWHLSLDRAQVTHYMLVRGGLSDTRIGHVEGYADRQVKAGSAAADPVNRRIEILLKDAA